MFEITQKARKMARNVLKGKKGEPAIRVMVSVSG